MKDKGMVAAMKSRASFITAAMILAICLVCHISEMFDQWDHTLQTGNDTEYTFVILALCVGVAFSLKWFIPKVAFPDSQTEAVSYPRLHSTFSLNSTWCPAVAIQASPPLAALRI
jgi:hypothetical protein